MAIISIKELRSLVLKALGKRYDQEQSEKIADVLMFGELSGHSSHGVIRLFSGECSILSQQSNGKPNIRHKTKVSSLIEGNANPGMLVGSLACDEVIRLAKDSGFGLVGTNTSFSSSGCLSYYLDKIAKANLIGVVMAQSLYSTPPHGGIEPMFGTNPIGFSFPTDSDPFIFDMATAAITFGDLLKAQELGQQLPENVAIDKDGNKTTSPDAAIDGATLPFDDSYKGAGLAMVIEILAGIWPVASFAKYNQEDGWGNLFIAMSPELLSDTETFKRKVRNLIESVRNSKTLDGSKIRISGESTMAKYRANLERGEIELDDLLVEKMREAAKG